MPLFERRRNKNQEPGAPSAPKAIGASAMRGNVVVTANEAAAVSKDTVVALAAGLKARKDSRASLAGRNIEGQPEQTKPRKAELQTPQSYTFAERTMTSPRMKEQISQLIFVGDSVLAVTSIIDDEGKKRESALSLLPIGRQSESEAGTALSSRTLLRMDPEVALKPRQEGGAIVAWEEATIGKSDITNAYGLEDDAVSGTHLKVMISARNDGGVSVTDVGSLNGVEVLDMNYLMRQPQDSEITARAMGIADFLQEHPVTWSREYADMQVVQPH